MIPVSEALDRVLEHAHPLPDETLPILETHGRVLAQPIAAREDLPFWDNSSMDGYAVRAADVAGSTPEEPRRLQVIGRAPAGSLYQGDVGPGQAVKIMTGAPMPRGADSVVIVERTRTLREEGIDHVLIEAEVPPGANVRRKGEEVRSGEVVLEPGRTIRASEVGMMAHLGYPQVSVIRTPRVGVMVTGDELLRPDQPMEPGKIRNSNTYSLLCQIRAAGAEAVDLGIVEDTMEATVAAFETGSSECDILVSSGGVSMGDLDFVRPALLELGFTLHFEKVALAPGKPTTFATRERRLVFGLPGNPVSVMVTFELFVRPAIRRLQGSRRLHRPRVRGRLTMPFRKKSGRTHFVRCRITGDESGQLLVTPVFSQSSGALRAMAEANALAVVERDIQELPAGAEVEAILLDQPETDPEEHP